MRWKAISEPAAEITLICRRLFMQVLSWYTYSLDLYRGHDFIRGSSFISEHLNNNSFSFTTYGYIVITIAFCIGCFNSLVSFNKPAHIEHHTCTRYYSLFLYIYIYFEQVAADLHVQISEKKYSSNTENSLIPKNKVRPLRIMVSIHIGKKNEKRR